VNHANSNSALSVIVELRDRSTVDYDADGLQVSMHIPRLVQPEEQPA
jgi:hypothetical protein